MSSDVYDNVNERASQGPPNIDNLEPAAQRRESEGLVSQISSSRRASSTTAMGRRPDLAPPSAQRRRLNSGDPRRNDRQLEAFRFSAWYGPMIWAAFNVAGESHLPPRWSFLLSSDLWQRTILHYRADFSARGLVWDPSWNDHSHHVAEARQIWLLYPPWLDSSGASKIEPEHVREFQEALTEALGFRDPHS
jgi:hypothetical protein